MNKEFTDDRCQPKDHTYPIWKPDIFIEGSDRTSGGGCLLFCLTDSDQSDLLYSVFLHPMINSVRSGCRPDSVTEAIRPSGCRAADCTGFSSLSVTGIWRNCRSPSVSVRNRSHRRRPSERPRFRSPCSRSYSDRPSPRRRRYWEIRN